MKLDCKIADDQSFFKHFDGKKLQLCKKKKSEYQSVN